MRVSDILAPHGTLARVMPGYESRAGQLEMAEAVEAVLARDGILLVEAGTGTGKTLAYLVPAILSGRKVIVSTGTRALQDQIMEQDVPLLLGRLGLETEVACLKGLANYLCRRRYAELLRSAESMAPKIACDLPILARWVERTREGDLAELEELGEDAPVLAHIASGSDTRIGPRCPHYEECCVTRARRGAESAQIVVVNHHLYFADLALRQGGAGGVLPEHDAVIFDEAHQLEDVATSFFGVQVSTTRLVRLCRDARRSLDARRDPQVSRLLEHIQRCSGEFFTGLRGSPEGGRQALEPEAFTAELSERMHALDNALDALANHARARPPDDRILQLARRAESVREDLATIAEGRDRARVSWTQSRGKDSFIGSSPVDVSELLREALFYRTPAIVLTSATLGAAGSFEFVERRLGIESELEPIEKIVPSPFDYREQVALYVAGHLPDPRSEAYFEAAFGELRGLLEVLGGGALVLCTSLRAMRRFHARALREPAGALVAGPILMQGEAPKGKLLERFRAAGDALLFATASFWEGVDVPGDALRLVVMDKLPFDVPSDPVIAARCQRLEAEGERSFMKYLVPAAALALKQGFGRLVRTRKDRGVVAILDSRIAHRGYGKVFLRSLPEAQRCESLEQVRRFWSAMQAPAGAPERGEVFP